MVRGASGSQGEPATVSPLDCHVPSSPEPAGMHIHSTQSLLEGCPVYLGLKLPGSLHFLGSAAR